MKFDIDEEVNIDLTPLIDVVFMLLIFFIMTTTFSKPVLDVILPESKMAESKETQTQEILISVTKDGKLYYNNTLINESEIKSILDANTDKVLNLYIDKSAPFQSFVNLIDIAKKERSGKFIISTDVLEKWNYEY